MYLARITEIEGQPKLDMCERHNEIYHLCFLDKRKSEKRNYGQIHVAPLFEAIDQVHFLCPKKKTVFDQVKLSMLEIENLVRLSVSAVSQRHFTLKNQNYFLETKLKSRKRLKWCLFWTTNFNHFSAMLLDTSVQTSDLVKEGADGWHISPGSQVRKFMQQKYSGNLHFTINKQPETGSETIISTSIDFHSLFIVSNRP